MTAVDMYVWLCVSENSICCHDSLVPSKTYKAPNELRRHSFQHKEKIFINNYRNFSSFATVSKYTYEYINTSSKPVFHHKWFTRPPCALPTHFPLHFNLAYSDSWRKMLPLMLEVTLNFSRYSKNIILQGNNSNKQTHWVCKIRQ